MPSSFLTIIKKGSLTTLSFCSHYNKTMGWSLKISLTSITRSLIDKKGCTWARSRNRIRTLIREIHLSLMSLMRLIRSMMGFKCKRIKTNLIRLTTLQVSLLYRSFRSILLMISKSNKHRTGIRINHPANFK